MSQKTPSVSRELVEYLERVFPDRCPAIDTPEREVWAAVGAAQVVRKLRQLHENQLKNALEGSVVDV